MTNRERFLKRMRGEPLDQAAALRQAGVDIIMVDSDGDARLREMTEKYPPAPPN